MATLDLTSATGGPIFLSRSSINDDSRIFGTFSASSMDSLLDRVVDGDPLSYWHSADAVSTEVLEFTSQLRTLKLARDVDLIAIQNINWRRFKVEYEASGGGFSTVPGLDFTASDNTDTDILLNLDPVISADTFKITVTDTTLGTDNKKLGGFYTCESQVQIAKGMLANPRQDSAGVRRHQMPDMSFFEDMVLRSAVSFTQYKAGVSLQLATEAELDSLLALHRDSQPFVFIPNPGLRDRDVFTVRMDAPPRFRFETPFTGNGYRVDLSLREAGVL